MSTKVYLAGPMSGIPDLNYMAFTQAAFTLRSWGYEVFNPIEEDLKEWGTMEEVIKKANYKDCLRKDLNWILDKADILAILPNWEKSKGVAVERDLAIALGLEIIYL